MYAVKVSDWTPTLPDETLGGEIKVAHVKSVVDGLDLCHLTHRQCHEISLEVKVYRFGGFLSSTATANVFTTKCTALSRNL